MQVEALPDDQAQGDGGVVVPAGDVPEGVRRAQHGEAEGEAHADEADAQVRPRREVGGQHRRATPGEHEPERAEQLRTKLAGVHVSPPRLAPAA